MRLNLKKKSKLTMEILYLLLGFSGGFIFGFVWEFVTMQILKTGKYAHIDGWHFHHSLFGLISFLVAYLSRNDFIKIMFFVGFGVGVITQHTITDRFVFLSRD